MVTRDSGGSVTTTTWHNLDKCLQNRLNTWIQANAWNKPTTVASSPVIYLYICTLHLFGFSFAPLYVLIIYSFISDFIQTFFKTPSRRGTLNFVICLFQYDDNYKASDCDSFCWDGAEGRDSLSSWGLNDISRLTFPFSRWEPWLALDKSLNYSIATWPQTLWSLAG